MARGTRMTPNEELIVDSLRVKVDEQRNELIKYIRDRTENLHSDSGWNLQFGAKVEDKAPMMIKEMERLNREILQTKELIKNIQEGVVTLTAPIKLKELAIGGPTEGGQTDG